MSVVEAEAAASEEGMVEGGGAVDSEIGTPLLVRARIRLTRVCFSYLSVCLPPPPPHPTPSLPPSLSSFCR